MSMIIKGAIDEIKRHKLIDYWKKEIITKEGWRSGGECGDGKEK
jgi:hypothetical protein